MSKTAHKRALRPARKETAPKSGDLSFLKGGGEMGERMRAFDWSSSAVGAAPEWPASLKTAVSICIGSRYPIVIWWGHPAYTMFYNDGYIPILGVTKHPGWLGRSGQECWKEIWSTVGPMLDGVFATGVATWSEDLLLVMDRNLPREETYFTFSYSPIHGDADKVDGIFCACYETTGRVVGERRLQTLRDLGRTVIEGKSAEEACDVAVKTLAANPYDIPFALVYLVDDDAKHARLVCSTSSDLGNAAAPEKIALTDSNTWPLGKVHETGAAEIVSDLANRFGITTGGPWPEPCESALVLPIAASGYKKPTGFLVAGLSPRRIVDAEYRSFLDLIAGHISTAIANARAYEEERKRAEALAEIDRAKTAFFSNVSHEFRTPLTLMLGPLEDTLAIAHAMPKISERLEMAFRNGVRLLKLVNTLLDFSRLEAGRIEAVFEAVDVSTLTRELASMFRSATDKAGLNLVVECAPTERDVYVDREMWEKVVLNLVSNAFKFTFEGDIVVTLREAGDNVELEVSDTGTGIPESELPHLFERFHRVKGARGRSYEGSGIGLALVHELVKLHGGSVRVRSEVEKGSTFTVSIPLGSAHLPADRVGGQRTLASTSLRGETYVDEVLKWLPGEEKRLDDLHPFDSRSGEVFGSASEQLCARILLADDNADMREYVRRLLAPKYEVVAVADGETALGRARLEDFDLILSDVMMPKLDGFGLVKALRGDERIATTPVILLSARAGEEASVEGMAAGADDYLVKPFSARELLARVEAHLNLQRIRRESEEAVLKMMAREQEARESAELANRIKDDFLAILSHELRTPLNAIVGWTHLLKGGKLSELDRKRGIDVIERNAAAQRAIIDELLDISRIVTGKLKLDPRPIELAAVVDSAVDAIRPAAERKNIQIITSLDRNAGLVMGEAVRLQQVIWNLLSNSVKFTPNNGRVEIELKTAGRNVHVIVRDTGEGIDAEFLPHMFERFRQADTSSKRVHGGLGLGLSIVSSLVTMHGGEVRAASDGRGKGATFTVILPVLSVSDLDRLGEVSPEVSAQLLTLRQRQNGAGEKSTELYPEVLKGLRVLSVDDQQDTRELITLALARYGAEVKASDSASTALQLVKEWKPHVIVSDIGLPGMDGYDFVRQLRALETDGQRIPAIAVTGYAGAVDESKALDAGYEVHLSKPIELNKLVSVIAKISRRISYL
ncbi:MAG TPA: ATP-binding protein [Pyrinomonadaceae bacterium]|nr:ATP-binding protein [Pyrinomonadaceae bacterium]